MIKQEKRKESVQFTIKLRIYKKHTIKKLTFSKFYCRKETVAIYLSVVDVNKTSKIFHKTISTMIPDETPFKICLFFTSFRGRKDLFFVNEISVHRVVN